MKRAKRKSENAASQKSKHRKKKLARSQSANAEKLGPRTLPSPAVNASAGTVRLGLDWSKPGLAAKQFIKAGGDIQRLINGFRELVMTWGYHHDDGIGERAFQELRRCLELGEANLQHLYIESCSWTDNARHAALKKAGRKFSVDKLDQYGGKIARWAADVLARHYRRIKSEIEGSSEATDRRNLRVPDPDKSLKPNFIRDCVTAQIAPSNERNPFKEVFKPRRKEPSGRYFSFAMYVLDSDGWDNVEAYEAGKINPISPSRFRTLTPEEFNYHWNRNGKTALQLKRELLQRYIGQFEGQFPQKEIERLRTEHPRDTWNDVIKMGWPPRELPLILICERELPVLWQWNTTLGLASNKQPTSNQAAHKVKPLMKQMLCERLVLH